jgi:molybdopterin converting factor small subunit
MKIVVALFGKLRSHLPPDSEASTCVMEIPEGSSVQSVLELLRISDEIPLTVFVNHVRRSKQAILKVDDRVGLFPPLAGG